MFDKIKWKLVEHWYGHPMLGSTELLSFTPDFVRNGESWKHKAQNGFLSFEDRMYLKKRGDKYQLRPGKTFLYNFNVMIANYMDSLASLNGNITDTGGTGRQPAVTANQFDTTAASGTSTYGCVVGSNNTAVTRTDTKLNTQITAGATAGTLQHGVSSVGAATNPSGTITRTQMQRSYTGNVGSTVNIQEDALYVNTSGGFKICLYRNINSFGAVANAQVVAHTINMDTTS